MNREVRRYPNLEALSRDAAALIGPWTRECVNRRGRFSVALSGGRSPQRLYQCMGRPPCDVSVPWSQVHFFWGDERCVAPTHPESNYGLAARELLHRLAPPPDHVHRPPADVEPPSRAASQWESDLRTFFGEGEAFPRFDLVLLGMGADGHTASLFPDDPALEESRRWVAPVETPRGTPPLARLTLTLPVLNHARCVIFLVSGGGKGEVVQAILDRPEEAARRYPAARVRPEGRLYWLLDGAFL